MPGVSIRLSWRGIGEAQDALDALKASLEDATEAGVEAGGAGLQRSAQIAASVNPRIRSGRLRASITPDAVRQFSPGVYAVEVAPRGVVYARVQELGAVIVAKRAPYLMFQSDVVTFLTAPAKTLRYRSGDWVKVKAVTIRSHPYLSTGLERYTMTYAELMSDTWAEAMQVAA